MLDVKNVSKTFAKGTVNEHIALEKINLHLDRGEFLTIVGSNGAGKSTLFNLICGTFMQDSGTVTLDGQDISFLPEHRRAKLIGRVFQDPMKGTAPNMTIEENLALAYTRAHSSGLALALSKKKSNFFREQVSRFNMGREDRKYKTFKRTDAAARELYYQELWEMVDALYNCPCIAMWVPFNEGWGQFDSTVAYNLLKEWDPTRTVDSASGWHPCGDSDVISKHIYFTPIRVHAGDKPWLLTEFGGYALKTPGHTWNERTFGYRVYPSKEKLTAAYQKLFNKVIIPQIKTGLAATVYTQVTDVEDEINGLMTYDRQVAKIDPAVLQKINEKVKY